uniref:Uncharacterized protein n=1 Tax=Anguilla anguilla TaxID=7936 RepID=A0A0E9T5Q7_ANGAN
MCIALHPCREVLWFFVILHYEYSQNVAYIFFLNNVLVSVIYECVVSECYPFSSGPEQP